MSGTAGAGRLRIYVDTSVIGGCLDPEFEVASRKLFEQFRAGEHILVISDITTAELQAAPEQVRAIVAAVPEEYKTEFATPAGADHLATLYVAAGVLPKWSWSDAQHIAIATLSDVDVLVSWNFKHIVNLQRIRGYNAVNAGLGYQQLEIRTPQEIIDGED